MVAIKIKMWMLKMRARQRVGCMWTPVTWIVSVIQFNKQCNRSTEHNMATLLQRKMFKNRNSLLSRQHTVNQSFSVLSISVWPTYCLVIQPCFQRNLFAYNACHLIQYPSLPPFDVRIHTFGPQTTPQTCRVARMWVEVGQPCCR